MKPVKPTTDPQATVHRRKLLGVAGTAGALAATATWLAARQEATDAAVGAAQQPERERSGGYRLSEHVQRYYQTTKV